MELSNPNSHRITGSEFFLVSEPITFKYVDNSTAENLNLLTTQFG